MRNHAAFLLVSIGCLLLVPDIGLGKEQSTINQVCSTAPVQTAILRHQDGITQTKNAVGGGPGKTQLVYWRRWGRPYGWYRYYGVVPRYYVGYRPVYFGSYAPYWGGFYGAPYVSFYAPRPIYYGGYGYGGCCYW